MVDAGDKQDAQGKTEKGIQQGRDKSNRHCNLQTIVFKSKKWQDAMNSSEMLTDLSNH